MEKRIVMLAVVRNCCESEVSEIHDECEGEFSDIEEAMNSKRSGGDEL